ncbi:MAG: hypothetical protein AAFV98_17000 [Chloroflexota bacterium]
MANFTINLIFASVFGTLAWNSLPRGWRFMRLGWLSMQANVDDADVDNNIEDHRTLSQASLYLLAGIAWLIGGAVSVGVAIMFVYFAFFNIGAYS